MTVKKEVYLDEIRKIVEKNDIELISDEYTSYNDPLKFRCKKCNKEWENSRGNIKYRINEGNSGMLCPYYHLNEAGAPRIKLSKKEYLEKYKILAEKRDGELLSKKYINSYSKLKWKCNKCGYTWFASPYSIKRGAWCPECAIEKKRELQYDIKDMQKLAKKELHGGKCLSESYLGITEPLKWKCGKCGNEFTQTPKAIKRGTLCPKCSRTRKGSYHLSSIEEMQKLAASKPGGGECLSEIYVNMHTALKWRCGSCGNEWEANPLHIKNGTWCPECAEGITERIYRRFFEALFHVKFEKYSPKWLIGSGGGLMHFDGYNKQLKLAFECQGIQHYQFKEFFHECKRDFIIDQKNDELKFKLAKHHGITIIYVNWIIRDGELYKLKIEEIEDYIRAELEKYGYSIPEKDRIDWRKFDLQQPKKLKKMEEIAKSRGGECLSEGYINSRTKLIWRCGKCGNIWKATPDNIKQGKWCPICAHKRIAKKQSLTIEEMKSIARERGGYCLSEEYVNSHTKLTWKCGICGKVWKATPTSVKGSKNRKGTWCPNYRTHKKILKKARENIIKQVKKLDLKIKNIKNYNGERFRLELECLTCEHGKNEEWISTKKQILDRNWKGCPKCNESLEECFLRNS